MEILFSKPCPLNLCLVINDDQKKLQKRCKIAVWFSYIFNICSDFPLDFHESIQVLPLKYLMYSLAGINTK